MTARESAYPACIDPTSISAADTTADPVAQKCSFNMMFSHCDSWKLRNANLWVHFGFWQVMLLVATNVMPPPIGSCWNASNLTDDGCRLICSIGRMELPLDPPVWKLVKTLLVNVSFIYVNAFPSPPVFRATRMTVG